MRYNQSPLPTDPELQAFQTPNRFGDNPQSFPCNAVQRCVAADWCAAREPDPKGKAAAAVQGWTYPALRGGKLLEVGAVSIDRPHLSPETERFVDVPYAAPPKLPPVFGKY